MGIFKNTADRFGTLMELFHFFWERKLWWLIPVVAVLALLGILMIFAQGTGIAPFIYALF